MKDTLEVDSGGELGCTEVLLGHRSQRPAYLEEIAAGLPATFLSPGLSPGTGNNAQTQVCPRRRRSVAYNVAL